jgi:hypothetical protein
MITENKVSMENVVFKDSNNLNGDSIKIVSVKDDQINGLTFSNYN